MRLRCAAGVLVLGVLGLGAPAAAASTPSLSPAPHVVFHLQDPRIDEASGLGVGVRSKGIDFVENDSGDTHRFFALDAKTGATAAVITVPHATNVDWEDLQVAPDAAGRSSVWVADTGDNDADRSEVDVYRVREPQVSPGERDVALRSDTPAVWRLRYPSGPVDAESLAVTPGGRAYIVTKNLLGISTVYALPAHPDAARVRTLSRIGTISFRIAAGGSPVGSVGSVLATSAAISRNGRLLAVRTYVYADVWRLHPRHGHDGVAAALRTAPMRIPLPTQRQGEGIAFARGRLLLDSEGVGTPVWSVPLPVALRDAATAVASSPASAAPTSTTSGTSTATPSPTRRRTANSKSHFGGASALILVVLIGAVVLLGRRARRYGDDGRG